MNMSIPFQDFTQPHSVSMVIRIPSRESVRELECSEQGCFSDNFQSPVGVLSQWFKLKLSKNWWGTCEQ